MFTEAHLVAFGNYLFKTYDVKFHSTDGKTTPLDLRQVTGADFQNWKHDEQPDTLKLPSKFQHGDAVRFMAPVKVTGIDTYGSIEAAVIGIHFYPGKVKYDLELNFNDELVSRIYNVDSALVADPIA